MSDPDRLSVPDSAAPLVQGLLVVNKPRGMTSRHVVDIVQRLVRPSKAGHAGTLDPLADGVLVVCVGAATRLIEYVQQGMKRYRATFLLGRHSPTEDIEVPATELVDPPIATRAQIMAVLPRFTGHIEQRPPAFSALKIDGRRAYNLARKGREVVLKPRPITIYQLELLSYDYPQLQLEIACGGGTYVRSLGRDIAEALGTAAVMSALTRSAIGTLRLEEAVSPEVLTRETLPRHLLPPLRAVDHLPRLRLDDAQVTRIRNGLTIDRPANWTQSPLPLAGEGPGLRAVESGIGANKSHASDNGLDPRPATTTAQVELYAAVDSRDNLIGLLGPRGRGSLGPVRNLAH